MQSGVLQGSCLGPLLFLAYTNDIDDSIKNSILKYADDIKIYSRIRHANAFIDINALQEDLVSLSTWFKTWYQTLTSPNVPCCILGKIIPIISIC